MYESKKMRDLIETVKKVMSREEIVEARSGADSLTTFVTPRLEKANSLLRRIKDFSNSDDRTVREFLQNITEVMFELDVIIKNKKVNPKALKVLQGVHEALAHNNRKVQEIWNGTSKTSGNFIANSFKKLIPTVISQVEIAKQEDLNPR